MTLPAYVGEKAWSDINVFGFMTRNPVNGTCAVVYRKGVALEQSAGSLYLRTSDDNGDTISGETEVFAITDSNVTNAAGGYTPTGRLIVFSAEYSSGDAWATNTQYSFDNLWRMYSDDDGATFSTPVAHDIGSATVFSAYGKLETLDDGYVAQCWYDQDTYTVHFDVSGDDGATWAERSVLPLPGSVTETDILALGNGNVMAIARTDSAPYLSLCTSTNNGVSWTFRGKIAHVSFAVSPSGVNESPAWLEKFTDGNGDIVVAMAYYLRNLTSGSQEMRVAYAYAADIISKGVKAFNIRRDDAVFSDGNGVGYPSIVEVTSQTFWGMVIDPQDWHFFGVDASAWTPPDPRTTTYSSGSTGGNRDIDPVGDVIRFNGITPTRADNGDGTYTYTWAGGTLNLSVDGTYYTALGPELVTAFDASDFTAGGTNTVEDDAGAVKVTYVDTATAATVANIEDLGPGVLSDGVSYLVTFDAWVNTGSVTVLINGTSQVTLDVTDTVPTTQEMTIVGRAGSEYMQIRNMGAGEVFYMRGFSIREVL